MVEKSSVNETLERLSDVVISGPSNGQVLQYASATGTWVNGAGGGAGGGTVTAVSVTTANGVSGTVSNPTTTPAISLTLGAITPSAVNVSGLTASSAVATDGSKNLVSVTNTGTGNNVLATSPTLVTPALGIPASGVLTNCTGLPNASVVGLGTAATVNTGTSGGTIPLLNANNTFSGSNVIQASRPLNNQSGTTYTFALTDFGTCVTGSNAGATTFTIPANATVAFPVGTEIDIIQLGAGIITIAAAGGVTLNFYGGSAALIGQYAGATIKQMSANSWVLVGNL